MADQADPSRQGDKVGMEGKTNQRQRLSHATDHILWPPVGLGPNLPNTVRTMPQIRRPRGAWLYQGGISPSVPDTQIGVACFLPLSSPSAGSGGGGEVV